jgi:hypothetical protein
MNQDEVAARLIVLETFVMAAVGIYIANTRNDPDYSKAAAFIEHLKNTAISNAAALAPAPVQAAAQRYATHLAASLAENIRNLHGEGGVSH